MLAHLKSRPRLKVDIPMTPLIDMVFLLLIYFLLTTNFMVDEGITIKLPQAKASAPQTEEEITVYINREGKPFLGREEVSLATLFQRLKEMIGNDQNKLVVIKADQAVTVNKAVMVMDVAKSAGAGRLVLATEKPF
ncbi:MAG: biopolymer transporter ExbD [Pseudomonadota bacterium]